MVTHGTKTPRPPKTQSKQDPFSQHILVLTLNGPSLQHPSWLSKGFQQKIALQGKISDFMYKDMRPDLQIIWKLRAVKSENPGF